MNSIQDQGQTLPLKNNGVIVTTMPMSKTSLWEWEVQKTSHQSTGRIKYYLSKHRKCIQIRKAEKNSEKGKQKIIKEGKKKC